MHVGRYVCTCRTLYRLNPCCEDFPIWLQLQRPHAKATEDHHATPECLVVSGLGIKGSALQFSKSGLPERLKEAILK